MKPTSSAAKAPFTGALKAPSGPEAAVGSGEAPVAVRPAHRRPQSQHRLPLPPRRHQLRRDHAKGRCATSRPTRSRRSSPCPTTAPGRWSPRSTKAAGEIAQPRGALRRRGAAGRSQGGAVTYGSAAPLPTRRPTPGQASTSRSGLPAAGRPKTSPSPLPRAPTATPPTASPTGSSPGTWRKRSSRTRSAARAGDPCPRSYSLRTTATRCSDPVRRRARPRLRRRHPRPQSSRPLHLRRAHPQRDRSAGPRRLRPKPTQPLPLGRIDAHL